MRFSVGTSRFALINRLSVAHIARPRFTVQRSQEHSLVVAVLAEKMQIRSNIKQTSAVCVAKHASEWNCFRRDPHNSIDFVVPLRWIEIDYE